MKKRLSAIALLVLFQANSQGDADLFRYSKTDIQGGARFEAMGGSFGALGADLSSSQINPAGFGRFSSTHSSASFGLTNITNSMRFLGQTTKTTESLFKLNSLGIVFVSDQSAKQNGRLFNQFGFGYNKLQNYTNSIRYEGEQFESLLDAFSASANGISEGDLFFEQPFSSFLAYWTFAIEPNGTTPSESYTPILNGSENLYHTRQIDTKGGMNEYYFSYSTNYMNKLYLGANFGIRTIRYDEQMAHRERVLDTLQNALRSFDYSYNLNTQGNGFNLKIGAIYLPQDNIRLGLSFHTATYYNLVDKTSADMVTTFDNQVFTVEDSLKPFGDYKYRLRTPPKIVGSAAFIFGTHGCINVDLEYINYKWANLRSTKDILNYQPYSFTSENISADSLLTSALNVRVGGELVLNSLFFVRGGARFSGNAYRSNVDVELDIDKSYSAGFGFRRGKFGMDFSYRYSTISRRYTAFSYTVGDIQNPITVSSSAKQKLVSHGVVLSANFIFN